MSSITYSFKPTWRHKGYVYGYWDDVEEDNIKRFHEVIEDKEGGRRFSMPIGPYQGHVSEETFIRWIDMGMPTREELGGHYQKDHDAYYKKWIDEQLEKELEL